MERHVRLLRELRRRGIAKAWLVGGVVRDFLLNKSPADIDVVCEESQAKTIIDKLGGAVTGKPPFCTVSTVLPILDEKGFSHKWNIEITLLTGGSIQKDLERRDFTINAIAMDINGKMIDPFDGAADIRRRVLRLVPALTLPYEADPIRVVRLLRFACALDFSVDSMTELLTKNFIREHRGVLANVPQERYGKEFLKGFASRPLDFLLSLEDYELLPVVLPEVEAMRGVEQPAIFHPEGDVLAHTIRVVGEAQKEIRKHPEKRDVVLALAALLHDVGKPRSARPHPKYDRACFFGHEKTGELMVWDILSKWSIPGKITAQVTALVRHHMIPGGNFTERTCVKLIRKIGAETAEQLFTLALCDARGTLGTGDNILVARELFAQVHDNLYRAQDASFRRWLDGNDVMDILKIQPSREVGRVLEELDVAVGAGELHSREEAIEWLRRKFGRETKSGRWEGLERLSGTETRL
ncbi:MAG: HD domain-containing protein [Synergistaceae bacterium]|jgi:tRNA nucleotidyltransferase/poly(A) polymerase|nr:HD domain-containing protein [Synergistaceae bacterium]